MARPVRIEYPGAVYHVICRGNNRQGVFRDDQDRKRYLERLSRHYPLKRIAQAVCKASDLAEEEIKRPGRSEGVQSARELLCYVSRRHSDVGLRELARFLGVKELSTPSHGVRRAEQRIKTDPGFRRQLEQVFKLLGHSPMQA